MAAVVLKDLLKKLCRMKKSPASSITIGDRICSSSSSNTLPSSSSSLSPSSSEIPSGWLKEDLHKVFSNYDTNGDGKISVEELEAMVCAMGSMMRTDPENHSTEFKAEAAAMLQVADLDGDGYIDFHEFITCVSPGEPLDSDPKDCANRNSSENEEHELLKLAFAVYDRNGDGVITAEELHHVLRRVVADGSSKTLADCRNMIRAVDRDGDGAISFREFVALMRGDAVTYQ